jgi:anti-sigma B factor antagonist
MSNVPVTDQAEVEHLLPDAADPLHLAVTVFDHGAQVVAHVTGEIDMATCGRLRDAIEPHLGSGQRVVLDLSGVTFMDSSCLGVLEDAHTRLTADGGSLILRNPSSVARHLISATGLTKLLAIEIG